LLLISSGIALFKCPRCGQTVWYAKGVKKAKLEMSLDLTPHKHQCGKQEGGDDDE
jgi:uncharacterized C2H2 Zn-finger protein